MKSRVGLATKSENSDEKVSFGLKNQKIANDTQNIFRPFLFAIKEKTFVSKLLRSHLPSSFRVNLSGEGLKNVRTCYSKHFGQNISRELHWTYHIDCVLDLSKATWLLDVLRKMRSSLAISLLALVYRDHLPTLEYGAIAWIGLGGNKADRPERFQRRSARIILGLV